MTLAMSRTALAMVLAVVSMGASDRGHAQRVAAIDPDQPASVWQRRVSLDLDRVPIEKAIKTLAAQGGLRVTFQGENLDQADRLVTLRVSRCPVDEAFRRVLEGTGLRAELLTRDVITIRRGNSEADVASGTITGRVTDAVSAKPILNASVALDGGAKSGKTDADGKFSFSADAGDHSVQVRALGYVKRSKTVKVASGSVVDLSFSLDKSTNTLDQVVVTGTVVATELKAVPNAITVITAKQIEERGITKIDQLFRGDVPGLFALNLGSNALLDEVTMFSRGATALTSTSAGTGDGTNPIKTYLDGVELADSKYMSQIDPSTIERIEILTGPQASTIYGSNALNGVMQIFTKRGTTSRPLLNASLTSGIAQNSLNSKLAPSHNAVARLSGIEGRWAYNVGGSVDYIGAWTPAKRTVRTDISGGGRLGLGKLSGDISLRRGTTQNRQGGDRAQVQNSWRETGLLPPNGRSGISDERRVKTLQGQTAGLTIGYRPTTWWTHELLFGGDADAVETAATQPRYLTSADTSLGYIQTNSLRTSTRYSTTVRLPVNRYAQTIITVGGDHWRTRSYEFRGSGTSIIGSLGNPGATRGRPGKNAGGFLQGQLGLGDALFLIYGLRAEWNPNYGDDAQPNLAPRYGVAYTADILSITTKLRASYGRSTRPPGLGLKKGVPEVFDLQVRNVYGDFDRTLANRDLGPEFQQGGEGGIELYFGRRGSVAITRYNQTVDDLIGLFTSADSARSLTPTDIGDVFDSDGYGYIRQFKYLNMASIRNQGWEVQATANTGPITTVGTYSWTKSRVIGVNPQYREYVQSGGAYQVGRSGDYLPEHTWALTTSYARGKSFLSLTANGTGQRYINADMTFYRGQCASYRDQASSCWRWKLPGNYRSLGKGYAMMYLNASHRLSSVVEATMQIQNLTNYFQQDANVSFAAMGRQTKIGVRWHK